MGKSTAKKTKKREPQAPARQSGLEIVTLPVSALKPYERNPRKNDAAVDRMVASIQEFGFKIPVLAKSDGEVIDGHLRLKAAAKLELAAVPVILCDDWSDAQVKAFRLLVNRSVAWAEWDVDLLKLEMADLKDLEFDLSLTGFEGDEISRFLNGGPLDRDAEAKSERAAELEKQWAVQSGQQWAIGEHRLLIGDAGQDAIPLGWPIDGICTDPPYELSAPDVISILSKWSDKAVVLTADKQAFGLTGLWTMRFNRIWHHRKPKLSWATAKNMPVNYHAHILTLTADHSVSHGWQKPASDYGSLVEVEREYEDSAMGHGKSAELFCRMLEGFPWKGVCDPFCGTGPTLLACETQGRRCLAIEREPSTAAVALQRWKDSGLAPRLAESEIAG